MTFLNPPTFASVSWGFVIATWPCRVDISERCGGFVGGKTNMISSAAVVVGTRWLFDRLASHFVRHLHQLLIPFHVHGGHHDDAIVRDAGCGPFLGQAVLGAEPTC